MNISSIGTTAGYTTTDRLSNYGPEKKRSIESIKASSSETSQQSQPYTSEDRQKQLDKSVERVLQLIQRPETNIERSVHEGTNQIIYKIMDKSSGEVIKEFPEEKLLDIATKIVELSGLLIDERV
jgi:flagellar protein FlaG